MAIRSTYVEDAARSEDVVAAKPMNGSLHPERMPNPDVPVQPPSRQESIRPSTPVPDLNEISYLLRQAKYYKQRRTQTQRLFHRLQTAASRTQRLAIASRHVRRTLAECLRSEDKHSFAHMFNTFQTACDQLPVLPLADALDSEPVPSLSEAHADSFLEEISSSSRETTLNLLMRLRYDKDFVADRVALLSHKELIALLFDGSSSRRAESVLGGSQRTNARSAKPLGFVVDRVVEDISTSGYRSSLETLVHLHNATGEGGSAYGRSTEMWAHVAGRLIAERKPGGDRLTSALLDIWSFPGDWPGKDRLQTWMLHTLHRGQFILEQPSRQSFRMRVQGQVDLSADETVRTNAFYSESVNELLDILGDPHGASVVPDAALDFTSAIHASLDGSPNHQRDLPSFVTTRWLFGSFLVNLIVLPESHGLLNGHYVSDHARLKILREVAARSQKVVFDVIYAWYLPECRRVIEYVLTLLSRKHGNVLSPETVDRVQKVVHRFDPSTAGRTSSLPLRDSLSGSAPPKEFLAVSAIDTVIVMNALFPARRPMSVSSDHDTLRSGLQSSASSISGFSLFRAADPSGAVWTPAASSPAWLSAPSEHTNGSPPGLGTGSKVDLEVMDARSELEEYVAGHGTNDTTHWALLVASDDIEQLDIYSKILSQDAVAGDWSNMHFPIVGSAKLPSSSRTALETLISSLRGSVGVTQTPESLDLGRAAAVSERVLKLFDGRIAECDARNDFVASHTWLSHLEGFEAFLESYGPESVMSSIASIENSARNSLATSLSVIDRCDEWLSVVRPTLEAASSHVASACSTNKALRTKIWYSVDVRTSSAYDNVRAVTSALRVMGKTKRASATKQAPPLRHWSGTRVSSQNVHLKSESQVLELLGTHPEHGGPNKLSDDQSRLTLAWLRRNDTQLICAGEERLHKLCMEVRKCVDLIATPSRQDSPLLWSNILFARDTNEARSSRTEGTRLFALEGTHRRFDLLSLHTNQPATIDSVSSASRTLSSTSSREYFDRSPTLAARSSTPFWSPAATEIRSSSSTTSIASHMGRGWDISPRKPTSQPVAQDSHVTDELSEQLTGLLLSDVGTSLFTHGSETDEAFFTGLGAELTKPHLESQVKFSRPERLQPGSGSTRFSSTLGHHNAFDYDHAFRSMFESFTIDCNPYAKLKCLNKIQKLIRPYLARRGLSLDATPFEADTSKMLPRSLAGKQAAPDSDLLTNGFYILFCQRNLRPTAIFRDLQYIASLVPSSTLDNSPQGQAFWNAAVAAIRLKSEARKKLVEMADSIIDYHTNNRGHGRSASTAQQQRDSATFTAPSRTPSAELIAHYSMSDAARLLQITAREGDPAAQRELATLYLTHPELMDHVIAPFALPGDVFKDEIEGKWKRDRDPERCDPRTMCVAHHWMVLGAKGGDALAREFLRQREEMERLP
jgi:hypothetical protein